MRVCITGQMFYGDEQAGPTFLVVDRSPRGSPGSYAAKVVSQKTGEILAEGLNFPTVQAAVEWCYSHSEW